MIISIQTPTAYNYPSYLVNSGDVNSVIIGIPGDNQKIYGISYTIQFIIKNILTERGSNVLSPERGCFLITILGKAVTPELLKTGMVSTSELLDSLLEEIIEFQDGENLGEEEIVVSLELTKFNFDPTTGNLDIQIIITTLSEAIPFLFSISQGQIL